MTEIYAPKKWSKKNNSVFYKTHIVLCILMLFLFNILNGQQLQFTVTGKVTDENGNPFPGANVTVEGTTIGTLTDNDGNYKLLADKNSVLNFSFIGYEKKSVKVDGKDKIDVTLIESRKLLDEVVVIGYSSQSRSTVTSSVSTIKLDELKNIPSTSPVQALQGKLAGVSIPVLSGQPGSSANIVIRGGTTLTPYGLKESGSGVGSRTSSDPLVVVDGVFRSMDDINPNDIESIQVMKDASSTAIYGARGANGVIVIKTKQWNGSSKGTISFQYQNGTSIPKKYDYMSAKQYLTLARQTWTRGVDNFNINAMLFGGSASAIPTYTTKGAYGTYKWTPAYEDNLISVEGQDYVDNLLAKGWETIDDPANPGHTIIFKDSHYQDVVWKTAHSNNYNLGFNGGSEAANYNISLGYVDQGGTFLGTGYKRFSGLANVGFKVNEKFSVTANLSYLWDDNAYSDNTQRDLTRGVRIPSLNRLYNDDGTPNLGEGLNPRNRLHQLYYMDNNENTSTYTMRVAGDYEIIHNLHYRPSASYNNVGWTRMNFEKYYPQETLPRGKDDEMSHDRQIMTDQILQYTHTFGTDHNIMALAGFNYTQTNYYIVAAASQRSTNDYVQTITGDPQTSIVNGTTVANFTASSSFSQSKSASYFGQVTYDYKNKYLVAATLRDDGFSNFAPKNRYALFPSVSVGWNITNESFWKLGLINNLKLRSSWGTAGNSNLSILDTYGSYGSTMYAQESGITRSAIPNPDLVWESTETADAGFDLSLFKSRLNMVFDFYNKVTKNRISSLPLPAETGFSSITYNIGSLRNRGIELEMDGDVVRKGNFSWNASFTFAFNRTVITKLPPNGLDKNRISGGLVYDPKSGKDVMVGGYAEGERTGGLWAWKSNGIFATDAEAQADGVPVDKCLPAANLGKPKHAGDVNWADINNDGVIDGKDLVFMGYRVPDKTGGMINTVRFKRLSMRFAVDYAMGQVINDGELARGLGQGRSYNEGAPIQALGNEIWQQQGDEGKKYPRFSFGDWDNGYRNHLRFANSITGYSLVGIDDSYGVDNSIYYTKGNWIAIRELSFSYELPVGLIKKWKLTRITLNAGVYNLGYISKYKGFNPEEYKGYDEGNYPRPRQYLFGILLNM